MKKPISGALGSVAKASAKPSVIGAPCGRLASRSNSNRSKGLMPRARLVVFEDSGHALYAEETALFTETVDAFLPRDP